MKHSFNVLLLLSFIVFCTPAAATTYYFSTSGSDSNNGLSSAGPKKSIAAANELMGDGNIILFKRGDVWYIPQGTIKLDNRSNCTLDAYGNGKRPVIAGMALIDDTWTYEGNNVWSNPTGYADALRVFVNNVSRISLRDKANNNPVVTDLNTTDEYLFDGASRKLYIMHTTSKTPPKNVAMIAAWPAPPLVSMLNTTNITLRNIEFWGGGNVSTIRIYAPSSNILIEKCIITRSNEMGIFAINIQQNMNVVENLVIQDCIIDKAWTVAENNLKPEVFLKGDGVAFMHGVKGSVVKNCKITNWGHDGVSVIATEFMTGIYGVKYNKIEGNDISAGNSGYMHAFSVTGFKDLAMYNIFKRNYCHDYSSGNTIAGNNNFVFSNIFADLKVSKLLQHKQAPHAMNVATWTLMDKSGVTGPLECKNNWIVNNTIYNTDSYSFRLDRSDEQGDVTTLMDNQIHNNLLLNWGLDTTYVIDPQHSSPPLRLGLRILVSVSAGATFFRNNNFWVNWDTTSTRRVALYRTSFYNAAQLTNCAECGPGNVTGNTQLNPSLGKFYNLTSTSSALLRSGGYLYRSGIAASGLPLAELVDYYGKPWPDPGISVGAIQY
ncbi:MAG TPA: right-handed parallel beta-helix repeat-containing protein [Flavitalea sp.]|nr:right-handed parallel beta-helix repeat-containing protein [Flavitalea sp.]